MAHVQGMCAAMGLCRAATYLEGVANQHHIRLLDRGPELVASILWVVPVHAVEREDDALGGGRPGGLRREPKRLACRCRRAQAENRHGCRVRRVVHAVLASLDGDGVGTTGVLIWW